MTKEAKQLLEDLINQIASDMADADHTLDDDYPEYIADHQEEAVDILFDYITKEYLGA